MYPTKPEDRDALYHLYPFAVIVASFHERKEIITAGGNMKTEPLVMVHLGRCGWIVMLAFLTCVPVRAARGNDPWMPEYATMEATKMACRDFDDPRFAGSLSWTFADCVNVWTTFLQTLPGRCITRPRHVDIWLNTADDLKQAGVPCLLGSSAAADGVGSSTIRHISTWIFAKEMGCDWVTPSWGRKQLAGGAVRYCHWNVDPSVMGKEEAAKDRPCMLVDWLSYFNMGVPSRDLPAEEVRTKTISELGNIKTNFYLLRLSNEVKKNGVANLPWDQVYMMTNPSSASSQLVAAGSWDERKNQITRDVLHEARHNFHQSPRPWYDGNLECGYDPTRLNFAVHVRLGDRRPPPEILVPYYNYLEEMITSITNVVVGKGLKPPLFHVFSETLKPCPSLETGVFEEFPTWPVDLDQVKACLALKLPDDCGSRKNGFEEECSPNGSGIFRVKNKPMLLHLSRDVQTSLSCMIQSDGVVMGCSTFGQIAGLFTKGISFFTVRCMGERTPIHYRTIPPLAVAERGHLWVPVAGTWHQPIFNSTEILGRALTTLTNGEDVPHELT